MLIFSTENLLQQILNRKLILQRQYYEVNNDFEINENNTILRDPTLFIIMHNIQNNQRNYFFSSVNEEVVTIL